METAQKYLKDIPKMKRLEIQIFYIKSQLYKSEDNHKWTQGTVNPELALLSV